MNAIEIYYSALDRLRRDEPINVKKGTVINKDTVALEAGRKRGSIRNRPGFEQLIIDIEECTKSNSKVSTKDFLETKLTSKDEEIRILKEENEKLKNRYMSLLYQNYEMSLVIKKAELKVPMFGAAIPISIKEET